MAQLWKTVRIFIALLSVICMQSEEHLVKVFFSKVIIEVWFAERYMRQNMLRVKKVVMMLQASRMIRRFMSKTSIDLHTKCLGELLLTIISLANGEVVNQQSEIPFRLIGNDLKLDRRIERCNP